MGKRDPNKTARNIMIIKLKKKRRVILADVIKEINSIQNGKYSSELSLNALIGSKAGNYIDLKEAVIKTPWDYKNQWLKGHKMAYDNSVQTNTEPRHIIMHTLLSGSFPLFRKYLSNFLESSFLKHYEEHYKKKPKISECEYWFGNNSDEFGILVTPRYVNKIWENDKSEIRHFSKPYWTIGHILETGLCYMNEDLIRDFSGLNEYLQFFRDMVRRSKSSYQLDIADRYINYVSNHLDPSSVPLLIPELRYDPFKNKHEHRLDYLIINPWTMTKTGFEFSPSSTHSNISGTKKSGEKKTLKEINEEVSENFEYEMEKQKKYWRKYGITYVVYTDKDLSDMDRIWMEIKTHLENLEIVEQLELQLFAELGF